MPTLPLEVSGRERNREAPSWPQQAERSLWKTEKLHVAFSFIVIHTLGPDLNSDRDGVVGTEL